jgi:hypothetical protein
MNEMKFAGAADIIKATHQNGIRIILNDNQLRISTKKGSDIDALLVDAIRENKTEIIEFLKNDEQRRKENNLCYDLWFDEGELVNLDQQDEYGGYDVMHQQAKEYLRFLIVGEYGYNLVIKLNFEHFYRGAIEWVFETLFNRHESLRTTFLDIDGKTRQFIHEYPMKGFEVEYIDLINEPDNKYILKNIVSGLSKHPFNFETGPLINVKIVHLTVENNLLLFTLHHVVSDEISLTVLRNELITLYTAYLEGKPNPLPPLSIQYKGYSKWMQNYLKGEKGAQSKKYYQDKIRGSLCKCNYDWDKRISYKEELHIELKDRLKVDTITYPFTKAFGLIVNINIEPGASYKTYLYGLPLMKLKRLATENNSSLFTAFLAVLSIMFYKVKNESNLRMYIPFSTRVTEKFDNIIGWLVGEIIVCIDVPDKYSVKEMIAAVETEMATTAYHRLYPHEYIMRDLDIPLHILAPFNLNFVKKEGFINDFTPVHSTLNGAHFDFKCGINDYENGLELSIDYKLSKYSAEDVETIFKKLPKFLNSIT